MYATKNDACLSGDAHNASGSGHASLLVGRSILNCVPEGKQDVTDAPMQDVKNSF